MSMSAILLISLAAAVVLVVGGGLMMYMSNLVRNAYDLKVQINSDMESLFKIVSDDVEKRAKWVKRDLIEEIDKIRANLVQTNAHAMQEMADPLLRRVDAMDLAMKKERADMVAALEESRQQIAGLESKIAQLRKDLRRFEDKAGLDPTSASGNLPPKAANSDGAPQPQTQAAPPPNKPREVAHVLPDLG